MEVRAKRRCVGETVAYRENRNYSSDVRCKQEPSKGALAAETGKTAVANRLKKVEGPTALANDDKVIAGLAKILLRLQKESDDRVPRRIKYSSRMGTLRCSAMLGKLADHARRNVSPCQPANGPPRPLTSVRVLNFYYLQHPPGTSEDEIGKLTRSFEGQQFKSPDRAHDAADLLVSEHCLLSKIRSAD
jgi:hypothetical protein